jgi:hypothetical protein
MGKPAIQSNPKVQQIFDDLEQYLDFCVEYGYVYDEAHLYDMKQFAYRQHTKQLAGKQPKNNWLDNAKP